MKFVAIRMCAGIMPKKSGRKMEDDKRKVESSHELDANRQTLVID